MIYSMSYFNNMSGTIYVVWEREFFNKHEAVYKIGRTKNIVKRFSHYPKGSQLLCVALSDNYKQVENDLIHKFNIKFKARPDIGREYFEGDIYEIIDNISSYVKNINNSNLSFLDKINDDIEDIDETENIEKHKIEKESIKTKIDSTIVIIEYVNEHRKYLNEITIKSQQFYQDVIKWINDQKYNTFMNHNNMIKDLINIYKVTRVSHQFIDGLDLALIFPKLFYEIDDISLNINNADIILQYLVYFYMNNLIKTEITYTSHDLYIDFISFITNTKKLSLNEVNYWNIIRFGMKISKICKQPNIGITKLLNYGLNKTSAYVIDNTLLKTYLVSQHLMKFE